MQQQNPSSQSESSSSASEPQLWRIVAGERSGVDAAALDAASLVGIQIAGFAAAGSSERAGLVNLTAASAGTVSDSDVNRYYNERDDSLRLVYKHQMARAKANVMLADALLVVTTGENQAKKGLVGFTLDIARKWIGRQLAPGQMKVRSIERTLSEWFSPEADLSPHGVSLWFGADDRLSHPRVRDCIRIVVLPDPKSDTELENRAEEVVAWLKSESVNVLNVTGPSEEEAPGVTGRTTLLLERVFEKLGLPTVVTRAALHHQTGSTPDRPTRQDCAAAMSHMYASRDAFLSSANQVMRLGILANTVAVIATGFVIGQFAEWQERWELAGSPNQGIALAIAAAVASPLALFLTLCWLHSWLCSKLEVGYNIYSSAIVHATALFMSAGLPLDHPWLWNMMRLSYSRSYQFSTRIEGSARIDGISLVAHEVKEDIGKVPLNERELVAVWRQHGRNMFLFYKTALRVQLTFLLLVCLVGGVLAGVLSSR